MGKATRGRDFFTKDVWLTPPHIIRALEPFDLDPCSEKNMPWKIAEKFYTEEQNGLSKPWNGFVWCNPPYGNQTTYWLEKLAEHGNGIALVFARTETKMFFNHVWPKATGIFFLEGRLKFHHACGSVSSDNCGAPSVLIAYGKEALKRISNSNLNGKLVKLS